LCIARQLPPLMRGPLGGSQASTETRVQQMAVYQTTFEINAPATRVWHVLTDLSRYSEWNPQIPRTKGRIEEGASINLRLALPGRPAMDVSAVIEQAQPDQLLTWRGHVVAPGSSKVIGSSRFSPSNLAGSPSRISRIFTGCSHRCSRL
jgi:hypothetical protein